MKPCLFILLSFITTSAFAQKEGDNWFLGTFLGMNFSTGSMQVIPVNTSKMYAPFGSCTWSDPATGQLLFYTSGAYVYNRQHQQMPNGFYINEETLSAHTVIVPVPGSKTRYYIFSTSTTSSNIYYTLVDMDLQNGLGDVVSKANVIDSQIENEFLVCSMPHRQGYWLITHKRGTNAFKTYRITKKGIEATSIVSNSDGISSLAGFYISGKMVMNATGTQLVYSYKDINQMAVTELFDFDPKCGTLTFRTRILSHPMQAYEIVAYPAFSPNDKYLYVNWIYNNDGMALLLQYNLSDPDPNAAYVIIHQDVSHNGDIQLAPDGKIYQATAVSSTVTSKLNVIESPDQYGIACNFKFQTIDLAPGQPTLGLYFTEHFPEYAYTTYPLPDDSIPVIRISNQCLGEPTMLDAYIPVEADSFYWDLGDGTRSELKNPSHTYLSGGTYITRLIWYTCGFENEIADTVRIGQKPTVNLGPDTTLCAGVSFTLYGPPGAEAYQWSTGDTTSFIQLQEAGTYALQVRNGACWNQDEILVKYYPDLWTSLGDEYTICDAEHELVKLDAGEGFQTYKWTPTGDTTQWIIVGALGQYFIVVRDFRGCSGEDGTRVIRRCPVSLYFPNAFTPNQDGVNDVYDPTGTDIVQYRIQIFNRWGQEVFLSDDIQKKWDGKVANEDSPEGVYYYLASYSGFRNKRLSFFEASGNISLIR
ncbi:MAG: gliding motility-associated C-terminal domain-containing protein [Bacteroidia bacterium]|jgi:gliding motility-associated-like protein